jgi:hypothetical protein
MKHNVQRYCNYFWIQQEATVCRSLVAQGCGGCAQGRAGVRVLAFTAAAHCCSKIAEAEVAVSVNEKKW